METWKHSGNPLFGRPRAQGVHISFHTSSMIPRRSVIPTAGCWMLPSLHSENTASRFTNPQRDMVYLLCARHRGRGAQQREQHWEKESSVLDSSSCPVFSVLPGALNKQSYHFEDLSPYWYEFFLRCLFCDHPCVYTYMLFSHNCLIFHREALNSVFSNCSSKVPVLWIELLSPCQLWKFTLLDQFKQGNHPDSGQKDLMWKENTKSLICAKHMLNFLVKNFSFLIAWRPVYSQFAFPLFTCVFNWVFE